jgi:prepilin-type N-terminal cleavage/methylation domain-containing protein
MTQGPTKGFSLVELLVVIAIMGILSSIVLAGLQIVRSKANDASIRNELGDFRKGAELIFSDTDTYDTVCDPDTDTGTLFRDAYTKTGNGTGSFCYSSGTRYYNDIGTGLAAHVKGAAPGTWAAAVRLNTGNFLCVNYKGHAVTVANTQPGACLGL